jgi:hypothetical protein
MGPIVIEKGGEEDSGRWTIDDGPLTMKRNRVVRKQPETMRGSGGVFWVVREGSRRGVHILIRPGRDLVRFIKEYMF